MPSVHCRCRSLHFRGPLMSASLMHIWHTSSLSFSLDQSIPVDGSSPTCRVDRQTTASSDSTFKHVSSSFVAYDACRYYVNVPRLFKEWVFISASGGFFFFPPIGAEKSDCSNSGSDNFVLNKVAVGNLEHMPHTFCDAYAIRCKNHYILNDLWSLLSETWESSRVKNIGRALHYQPSAAGAV